MKVYYYIKIKNMKKLLTLSLILLMSLLGRSQTTDSIKCSYRPLVFHSDSIAFDYRFISLDVPTPLCNYSYTSDDDLYRSFVFYPHKRYAKIFELENQVVNGKFSCPKWTTVNIGSTALTANYILGDFYVVCVYEYHYFEWGPIE